MLPPSIAVVGGTGHQGRGIAQRLAVAGFSVVVASRDPERAAARVAAWRFGAASISTATYPTAIAAADVVFLAVPFETVSGLLEEHSSQFRSHALVIDVTVPLTFTGGTPAIAPVSEGSAAEHVRSRLPAHVRVAGTFKTVPAPLLADVDQSLDCDEFVCGDSVEARSEAIALVQAVRGLRAVDVGPLARARSIEHLTLLAIGINRQHEIRSARFRVIGL